MKDLVTEAELICPKCRLFPCTCPPPAKVLPAGEVCTICRRGRLVCLCTSHVAVTPVSDESESRAPVKKHNPKTIEKVVNECMTHYYNRDPAGLARYVRELLRAG